MLISRLVTNCRLISCFSKNFLSSIVSFVFKGNLLLEFYLVVTLTCRNVDFLVTCNHLVFSLSVILVFLESWNSSTVSIQIEFLRLYIFTVLVEFQGRRNIT